MNLLAFAREAQTQAPAVFGIAVLYVALFDQLVDGGADKERVRARARGNLPSHCGEGSRFMRVATATSGYERS